MRTPSILLSVAQVLVMSVIIDFHLFFRVSVCLPISRLYLIMFWVWSGYLILVRYIHVHVSDLRDAHSAVLLNKYPSQYLLLILLYTSWTPVFGGGKKEKEDPVSL